MAQKRVPRGVIDRLRILRVVLLPARPELGTRRPGCPGYQQQTQAPDDQQMEAKPEEGYLVPIVAKGRDRRIPNQLCHGIIPFCAQRMGPRYG
jgi:hypothetical protein